MLAYRSLLAPKALINACQSLMQARGSLETYLEKMPITQFPLYWPAGQENADTYKWTVNKFDCENLDDLRMVPIQNDEPWETLEALCKRLHVTYVFGTFPAILQIQERFLYILTTLHVPGVVCMPQQNRAGLALKDQKLPLQLAVMTQDVFPSFSRMLREHADAEDPYYQVIFGAHEQPVLTDINRVFFEMHLVPGIVGLFQCEHLTEEKRRGFHLSDRFLWEIDGHTLRVTDIAGRFTRAELPHSFSWKEALCACGRNISVTYI